MVVKADMKKLFLVLILMMSGISASAQESKNSNDTSFRKIEKVPVFPGCRGNNKRLKKCFNKKMTKHLSKKFNSEIVNEIDLPAGVTKIILMFKIDKNGEPTDFNVKAPHEALKKEGIRVLKLLSKFKPGRLDGKPVGVKYAIPMMIKVEEVKK